jgi:spermidine/putrescine transport system ATP-binding protein
VSFGLTLKRMGKQDVAQHVGRALELVRLPGFEQRKVRGLSGGEAQRVALARALVNRPKVHLLDEPLSALDLQIRRELQVELRDIHRETGRTFIYVTHDQEEAMSMSDRIVLMNKGRIVQIGSPVGIYREPASVFAASFVGSSNLWAGTVASVDGERVVVDVEGTPVAARPLPDVAMGDRVWVLLRPESLSLRQAAGEPAQPGTSVRGRDTDGRFVGSIVHYRVALDGRELVASRPPDNGRLFAQGEDVDVTWRPDDVVVLED